MNILAQLVTDNPALYTYGPLGIFCAFFMWRDVSRQQTSERERDAFVSEMKAVRHSMDGLQRAFLVHMVELESVGPTIRDYANKQIAKLNSRLEKDE